MTLSSTASISIVSAATTNAVEVVAALTTSLRIATGALAKRCGVGERLDAQKLDDAQIPSFELAWAAAEIAASSASLSADSSATDLDRRIALVYAADALTSALNRLDRVSLETGVDSTQLVRLRASESWHLLQRAGSSSSVLEEVVRRSTDLG